MKNNTYTTLQEFSIFNVENDNEIIILLLYTGNMRVENFTSE